MTLIDCRSQKDTRYKGKRRTACVLKADNNRNAPKFVEWEPVRVKVNMTFQGC